MTVQSDNSLIPTTIAQQPQFPPTPESLFYILTPAPVTPSPISSITVGQRVILYSNSYVQNETKLFIHLLIYLLYFREAKWVAVDRFTNELRATATAANRAAIFTVASNTNGFSLIYSLNRFLL